MIKRALLGIADDFGGLVRRAAGPWPGVSFGVPGAETWESSQNWLRGLVTTPGPGLTAPYAQHATIALALSTISHDSAVIPWEAWKPDTDRGEGKPLEDHPILAVLARPSIRMSGLQLWVGTYLSRLLFGEAFWYYPDLRVRGKTGIPTIDNRREDSISLLDPRRVKHDVTARGEIVWSLVIAGGEQRKLPAEQLTQFKRYNPYDPIRGLSIIEAILRDAAGDYAAASWNERFFSEQNGIPTGILIPHLQSTYADDKRESFLRRWNERSAQRRVGMVPPGWDWKDIGINQRDMDFGQLRKYSREQILAMCGLPPFYAGVLENANYANAREQKEVYWLGTIKRNVAEVQDALNNDFVPKVGLAETIELWPCWEEVSALVENYGEKLEAAGKLFNLGVPLSVINERLDLGLDMDKVPTADVGFLPFSVAPSEQIAEPGASVYIDSPEEIDAKNPSDEGAPPEGGNGESRSVVRAVRAPLDAERERRRAMVWRNLLLRTRDLEERFARVMRSHFHTIEQDVLAQLGGIKGVALTKAENINLIVIATDEQDRALQAKTEGIHREAVKRGGGSVVADMGVGVSFDIDSPVARAKLAELTSKIVRVNETLEKQLRAALLEGFEAGEGVDQLARRVESVIAEASRSSAVRIARTEVGTAFNGGRYSAEIQLGVEWHEWLTARDGRVRDAHVVMDGEVVSVGTAFSNGLRYPQDQSGPADEVINCRCVPIPVVRREGRAVSRGVQRMRHVAIDALRAEG